MRKLITKIVITMAVVMALLVAQQCMTAEVETTKVYAAENKTTNVKYTLKKGVLTISGKGEMPKSMTFKKNKKIKKVIIKKGVTSICKNAFLNCKNLKSVKIANTVKVIGKRAFKNTALINVDIPKNVKEIGNAAFMIKSLKKVTMSGKFEVIGEWHNEYYNEESVVGPNVETVRFSTDFNISEIKYIEASNLEVLANDPKYKSIDGVIYSKSGKRILGVPILRKSVVMVEGCKILDFSAFNYGKESEGELSDDSTLESLTVASSVNAIDFDGDGYNYTLKEIKIKTAKLSDEEINELFDFIVEYCPEVNMRDVVKDCANLYKCVKDKYIINDKYYVVEDTLKGYFGNEEKIIIPEGIKYIGNGALRDNTNVKEVVLPETVKEIYGEAFLNCKNLKSINLPNSLLKIWSEAFKNTSLSEIKLPESLKYIGKNAFRNVPLKDIEFPKGLETIEFDAFRNTKIKTINVPTTSETSVYKFSGMNIEKIEFSPDTKYIYNDMFYRCNKLKEVEIPEQITEIGSCAFEKCNSLKKVTIKGKVEVIADSMFRGCKSLESVECSYPITEIGYSAFEGCVSLKISIPNTVKTIGDRAFKNTNWMTITIPKSVENVGSGVFDLSEKLRNNEERTLIINCKLKALGYMITNNKHIKIKYPGKVKNWKAILLRGKGKVRGKTEVVKINWNKIVGASGYEVAVVSENSNEEKINMKKIVKKPFVKLTLDIKKYFPCTVKVRAYKKINGKKIYGKWSDYLGCSEW